MKRLLVCNFFPAFDPPTSGGEQRYHYLYRELSRRFDVTLLSPTHGDAAEDVVEFSPSFREHRVPKHPELVRLHLELGATGVGPECSAMVVALAARLPWRYGEAFEERVAKADLIVHECPYTYAYDRGALRDGKPRVYNSYNVEAELMAQMLGGSMRNELIELCSALEQALVTDARRVFATSREERAAFALRYGRALDDIDLVPNGFDGNVRRDLDAAPRSGPLVFMGSRHPPNVAAARYVLATLAPAMPQERFVIFGSVCAELAAPIPPNVELAGLVSEERKHALLASCRIALNPMETGAGTNLKMLDYLAAGAPIATTTVGARGLELEDGRHARIATDASAFRATLEAMLADPRAAIALGAAGREVAQRQYTWSAIAQRYGDELDLVLSSASARVEAPRLRVLVLNDFPVSRAGAGGEVRINRLHGELSRAHDVELLCLGDVPERREVWITPGFVEICIPKTDAQRRCEHVRNAGQTVSGSDVFASYFCLANEAFVAEFDRRARDADVVVLEHPYLAPMLERLPADVPVVYDALNVESALKSELLAPRADRLELLARVEALEREVLRRAALVLCVSEADRDTFATSVPERRYVLVPNGVDCDAYRRGAPTRSTLQATGGRPLALFLGSAHPPNIDAARFVVEALAPALPELGFALVGSCCDAFDPNDLPPNVALLGVLDSAAKDHVVALADVAVNPMATGGGSSLKVAEFLAAGVPVVTTEVGARGFAVRDRVHVLITARSTFVAALRELLSDPRLARRLAAAARHLARTMLDWRGIGECVAAEILRVARPRTAARAPRLLVVTYRYTAEPRGGAERFLAATLAELAAIGDFEIDLCATDAATITDRWQYSAAYTRSNAEPVPAFVRRLRRFPVDADDPRRAMAICRDLFRDGQRASLGHARALLDVVGEPVLLGGWHAPERDGDAVQRWSGGVAEVWTGRRGPARMTLRGSTLGRATVRVRCAEIVCAQVMVDGAFELWCAVPSESIATIEIDPPREVPGDARALGLRARAIHFEHAGAPASALDLTSDYADVARRADPARWVASLIALAEQRPRRADEEFLDARGPASAMLDAWLDRHIGDYDLVLAQGVPFATVPRVVARAAAAGVPCVALPHFHIEDPYYHWRCYYEAFRRAHAVVAAPNASVPLFFAPISASAVALPGGGADPADFAAPREAETAFRAVHRAAAPFVLVAGRKAGAKRYREVVDAVAALRRGGADLDLVMIGPDEDGVPLHEPWVHYLGAQPRAVLVGALGASVCLATMSESESFGIVIVESWLAARPVVAYRRCAAFAELVSDGEDGFLVENVSELADRISRYSCNRELALRHAAKGRERALQHYTWEGIARRLNALCLAAVASANASSTEALEA